MQTAAHPVHHTWAEYLAREAASNVKHEYLDGQIYAMAGCTPDHAALQAAFFGLLVPPLRAGHCRAYGPALRVRVLATGLATYPDATVVCGRLEIDPDDKNTITNPTLILEVLSPSTEEYDRGEKFEHYKRIPSLREYVLVSHCERSVEVWTRAADGRWIAVIAREGEVATVAVIGAGLDVRELYEAAAEPPM